MDSPTQRAYPPDLARYVEAHWPSKLRVPSWELEEALATAFQASLTSEEARPTRFRLLLTPPEDLPVEGTPNHGALRLLFDRRRPFEVDELRRLAPAVPFESALIGVDTKEGELGIWGIAHSGPAWLSPARGGRSVVPNWTYDPIIHATAPGQLAVRCAGKLIGALERGTLVDVLIDVFDSAWLPALFLREREEIQGILRARGTHEIEHQLIGRLIQHMLRRAIQLVRNAHHGGLILVAPSEEGVNLKYRLIQDEPSHRLRSVLLQIIDLVARKSVKETVGWADYLATPSSELERLESAMFEWSRVVANLAAIDGAVMLDKAFGLLGFGVEVPGDLPRPLNVWRALDTEGNERRPEEIESRGTRHRAAYRFVNAHPGGLAVVMSHDGGVSFVAKRGDEVMVWEQSVGP